jgi:multiple sugar transport system substrate-binding protein
MAEKSNSTLSRRDFLRAAIAMSTAAAMMRLPAGIARAKPLRDQAFLNYWTGWSGFEFDELQKLVDQFNKEHPDVFVNMTTVFGQYDKVLTAIAGGNPPDVVSAVWLHQLVSMAARGGLSPITDLAKKDGIDGKGYFPQLWENWQWNGQLWGLMVTSNSSLLAYSPKTFESVGVKAPPKSLEELDEISKKLEKVDSSGNIERVGILPGGLNWWGRVFGGNFYDEANKKVTANDPKIVAALDWMASYWKRLKPDKVAAFQSGYGDYMSPQNSFFVGKENITQVGEWFIQFQQKFAPDLGMEMMAAPPPKGGRENCTVFDGSVFTIPAGVRNKEASWSFIKWLSEDQHMGDFCFAIHNVPPKAAPASADRFVKDKRFKLALDLLNGKNAFGPDKMPVNDFYFTRIGEAETSVKAGQATAQEALDRVTKEVQAELDKTMERLKLK